MGPGPSGAHPRVLKAMTAPILGHLDPEFLRIMDECNDMLRTVMCTENRSPSPPRALARAAWKRP